MVNGLVLGAWMLLGEKGCAGVLVKWRKVCLEEISLAVVADGGAVLGQVRF